MKKVTLFAAAAIMVASISSCRKNHSCVCNGSSVAIVAKSSKKDAQAYCTAAGSATMSYTTTEHTINSYTLNDTTIVTTGSSTGTGGCTVN